MNTKDFLRLGVPLGEATRRATDFVAQFILGGGNKSRLREEVAAIIADPSAFVDDTLRAEFAKALLKAPPASRAEPVKYRQWGEHLEHDAVMQMEKACLLPVSVAGALMPDAHVGYGLPIGGVLATENAVKRVCHLALDSLNQVGKPNSIKPSRPISLSRRNLAKADGVAVRCAQSTAKWRSRFATPPASHPESLLDPRNRRCSSPPALCP